MEELSYVLTQYFVSCVHVRFYFSLPACRWHFSLSHSSFEFSYFSSYKIRPFFSITLSSSFSVTHVSINIKNNVEKDTTLLLFFLSESPGVHAISFQIKPWVTFGLPYLLTELFYIGMPLVRTDSRAVGRCTVTWLPNFLGWVVYHIFFTHGAPLRALRARAPL